jgi:hypothetical protein
MSAFDFNPVRRTLGWDNVTLPPKDIVTDINLKPESERNRALNELFKSCATCSTAGLPSNALLRCSGCRTVRYCDKECQRKH